MGYCAPFMYWMVQRRTMRREDEVVAMNGKKVGSSRLFMRRAYDIIRLFSGLVLLIIPLSTWGDGWLDNYFRYDFEPGSSTRVHVTGTINGMPDMTFPPTVVWAYTDFSDGEITKYRTCTVVGIGARAFEGTSLSGAITISSGISYIGYAAFKSCHELTSVTLSEGLTRIDDYAFDYCRGLTGTLTIPSSVTRIGYKAFHYCKNLTKLNLQPGVETIGDEAFSGCPGFTGELLIPATVINIGTKAFYGCGGFTGELKIPSSVESIGVGAFRNCNGFSGELIIPSSLGHISDAAFCECGGITKVIIPSSIKSIGASAFDACTGITEAIVGHGVESIGFGAFRVCINLKEITIPSTVTNIGENAFYNCDNLTNVVFKGRPPVYSYYKGQSIINRTISGTYPSAYKAEWEAVMDNNGYWHGLKMKETDSSVEVVVNFSKEATEPNQSYDKAYWMCRPCEGCPTIRSGEPFTLPVGTYTISFYSGEDAFADPEPMQITLDGTRDRIELDVELRRKIVSFSCVFYNTRNYDYGMFASTVSSDIQLDLDSYCKWRVGNGVWYKSGETISLETGSYVLTLDIDAGISMMAQTDILQDVFELDGKLGKVTKYINAIGEGGAAVTFSFSGSSTYDSMLNSGNEPVFNESCVRVILSDGQRTMTVRPGKYCLVKGRYRASFRYGTAEDATVWHPPEDIEFSIDGQERNFHLNFIFASDFAIGIWYDANGGTVDTPLLYYALPSNGNLVKPLLGQLPTPRKEGFSFKGWWTEAGDGGWQIKPEQMVPSPQDTIHPELTNVSGEDANINGRRAFHVYAHWQKIEMTADWLSWFPSFFNASDGDITTAASMTAANGCRTLDECYNLGINPEDPGDDLKITGFKMKDGKPLITINHTEDGSGNSFEDRIRTLGKKSLEDADWVDVTGKDQSGYRFFKASVELP